MAQRKRPTKKQTQYRALVKKHGVIEAAKRWRKRKKR